MSPRVTRMSVSEAVDLNAAASPHVLLQVGQVKKTPPSPRHPRDFKTKCVNSAGHPHKFCPRLP